MLQYPVFTLVCAAALYELSGPVSTIATDDDLLLMTPTPDPDPTLSHATIPALPQPQSHPEAALPPADQWDMSQGQNLESFVAMPLPEKGINSEPAPSSALRPSVLTFNPCPLSQTCLSALKSRIQLSLKYPCIQKCQILFIIGTEFTFFPSTCDVTK